ncbi:hypothetical protein QAD02_018974 [Eretmocerus hayati]|uniref:Uncharacterized protein n=1 Tax=Eretmocerus hayati TaxID=131215 RepID=A0ACC2PII1_9HYME|nr:hypothetical protein QAD02_018974 [Eretmocerus hayati]
MDGKNGKTERRQNYLRERLVWQAVTHYAGARDAFLLSAYFHMKFQSQLWNMYSLASERYDEVEFVRTMHDGVGRRSEAGIKRENRVIIDNDSMMHHPESRQNDFKVELRCSIRKPFDKGVPVDPIVAFKVNRYV